MRALMVAAAVVVAVASAGCSAEEPDTEPAAPADPFTPVDAQVQVRMLYTGVPGVSRRPSAASYDAAVELGAPVPDGVGCGLAAPAGTVTVPLTLTLVHTADPDRPVQAAAPSSGTDGSAEVAQEPLSADPVVAVEVVGGAGPLRWEAPRGGDCTDEPDLSATNTWEYREQVQVRGYLTGVPAEDPAGAGVRVEFTKDIWEIHAGAPEPLTVTY